MRYRRLTLDRGRLDALLRSACPDLPADARLARAEVLFHGGLRLTIHSDRFALVPLLRGPGAGPHAHPDAAGMPAEPPDLP